MVQGKGRMIFGRACRTEPVRANRESRTESSFAMEIKSDMT